MSEPARSEKVGEPDGQRLDTTPDDAGESSRPSKRNASDLTALTGLEETDGHNGPALDPTAGSHPSSDLADPPLGRSSRSPMRRLMRVLLTIIVLGAIGVGIYLAWPVVFDRYVQPVRDNTAELALLDERVAAAELRLTELEGRAAAIEGVGESLTAIQAGVDDRVGSIEDLIAAHGDRLDALDDATSRLEAADEAAANSTLTELGIVRSMELLSRARLFLYQANYGLAAEDLTAARSVLAELEPATENQAAIESTLFRIDLALSALPDRPVAASDDLDIAWQTLLGDVPSPAPSTTTTTTTPTTTTTAP